MTEIRARAELGRAGEDWDLDAWMAESFGIWREDGHDATLRVASSITERDRNWRFHPSQHFGDDSDELIVRFHVGGTARNCRALVYLGRPGKD